jgi:hypothetical protein
MSAALFFIAFVLLIFIILAGFTWFVIANDTSEDTHAGGD